MDRRIHNWRHSTYEVRYQRWVAMVKVDPCRLRVRTVFQVRPPRTVRTGTERWNTASARTISNDRYLDDVLMWVGPRCAHAEYEPDVWNEIRKEVLAQEPTSPSRVRARASVAAAARRGCHRRSRLGAIESLTVPARFANNES